MNIEEANQELAKKYLLSGEYPGVCATGYGPGEHLTIYTNASTKLSLPQEYQGFPVKIETSGNIKAHHNMCVCDSDPGDCYCPVCNS